MTGEGSAQLLKAAKERGVITSMDVTSDRSGRWKGILDPCWPYLDYFLPSIEQASQIAGTEDLGLLQISSWTAASKTWL